MNMFEPMIESSLKTSWKNIISNFLSETVVYYMNAEHASMSPTGRPFWLHKTSKTPFWWLLFSHKTHTRTFSSPHATNNIQYCYRQLWRQNVLCNRNGLIVGDRKLMIGIILRHVHLVWEVWDYIIPWCLNGWTTQVSKHMHSHFCCRRELWDKILINQCKCNNHRLRKWRCWEEAWLS